MRIERMGPGDEQRVLEAAHLFNRPPDAQATAAYLAHDRNYLLLAYLDDGAPAGFVRGIELQRFDGPARQMLLYHIAVLPKHRRRGIGAALVGALERICRDKGFAEMFVITNRSNAAAMRLYASTGAEAEADDDQLFVWSYAE